MAIHIYIAGVEQTSKVLLDSFEIEQVLTMEVDVCSFRIQDVKPNEGQEIKVEDDALGRMFAGIIDQVKMVEGRTSKYKFYDVGCQDYTYLINRKLVVETYKNMTADAIFRDIAQKYCPGFTLNGVATGAPDVEELTFDYAYPSECFKQLCDYVGWQWQPDYYKDLMFFNAEEINQTAPILIQSTAYFRRPSHTIDQQGLRNRVYVRGGTMLSDFFPYEIKTDGQARIWTLPHKPHEISMTVAGSPVTLGVENLHDEADYDYMMNFQEKYVRSSSQTSTILEGTTISWTYKYDIDVITMVEDIASQQAIAAVQGGDGVFEHVITDDSLVTIEGAEAAGNADLREHGNPRVKGSFETEYDERPIYQTWNDIANGTKWGDL